MLGAALMHPDRREVIALMPEPIGKHDGSEKNDCERNAAKRFLAKLRQDHPHLKFIVTEDSLSSNAPHIETLHDYGCHDRSEEHTSELQSRLHLVCRLLLEKKKHRKSAYSR